jgi:succinylarginine dihydrolase
MTSGHEVNFDQLPCTTHGFAGLSTGNLASLLHKNTPSNPRKSALEGLEKMKMLMDLGIKQAVLPPQVRPSIATLKELGFTGSNGYILETAYKQVPEILFSASSSSFMWAANHMTTTPRIDAADNHTHFTPANLSNFLHRSIETDFTSKLYREIFKDPLYFTHHNALPSIPLFADEGAANHMRFSEEYTAPGIHLFVYGKEQKAPSQTKNFTARQAQEAQRAIARSHCLYKDRTFYARQTSYAIDKGVFHNDVIAASNQNFLLVHEKAWVNQQELIIELKKAFEDLCDIPLYVQEIQEKEITLNQCVKSYLFNSQIITLPDGSKCLIAENACRKDPAIRAFLDKMLSTPDHPISSIHYVDLKESMQNGGGPACLRQRIVLTENEINTIDANIFLTKDLYVKLKKIIETHYREELHLKDLQDVNLLEESYRAYEAFIQLLKLPNFYELNSL